MVKKGVRIEGILGLKAGRDYLVEDDGAVHDIGNILSELTHTEVKDGMRLRVTIEER